MNKEALLKHTTSYEEELLEDLKDPEEARGYLEAAFESYEGDGNTESLLLAMRDVAEAQGGIGELAKRTAVSREHLYEILAGKYNPRLDNWLNILSGLGFRVRLERQEELISSGKEVSGEPALAHKE
jgi:probable addiction module antidote protein